jgi:hypothetical protein
MSTSDFSCEKILGMPSFGRELKPFAPCRRFLNGVKWRHFGNITGHHSHPQFHLSLLAALALLGMWRHLAAKVGTSKGRGNNGKLLLRTCLVRSVPEPYRSPDWALVPAKPAQRLNTNTNNNNNVHVSMQAAGYT